MTDADPGEAHAASMLEVATRHYHERAWPAALMLFRAIHQRSPALALRRGVPLAIDHCLIELQDDVDPGAMARALVGRLSFEAVVEPAYWMRSRAVHLCRAGDFARARRLLRYLAAFDGSIGAVYHDSFLGGRTGCWEAARDAGDAEPEFLQTHRWSDAEIVAHRERFRGRRILFVMPLIYDWGSGDQWIRSARLFGLAVEAIDRDVLLEGTDAAGAAARLEHAIDAFRPDVIFYNSFFELPLGKAEHVVLFEHMAGVLMAARRRFGARVVACFRDAWVVPPENILRGLGESIDLVAHLHPALRDNPALRDPRVYDYMHPVQIAPPTARPGSIARACAVGSINYANVGRVVWWAESATSDVPLDFAETHFQGPGMRSAEDYANLLCAHQVVVNLTRRTSNVKIITGRTLEVLAVGGVLAQEDSVDTRYFLQPGRHYMPFETWDDLAELIPWLLDHPEHRARLAHAGRAWVDRYFRGDRYWAGLLDRLYPAHP